MFRSISNALVWAVALLLLVPCLIRAEGVGTVDLPLGLSECIDIALRQNAQLLAERYNVSLADANLDNARNAFLPTLNSGYGISRNITGPREGSFLDPATGLLITTLGESRTSGSQSVSGSIAMSVYNPADWATLSARKKGLKASELTLTSRRQQVVFEVRQGYFDLLKAIKLLEVQKEQIRVSEENLRRAETLYEIGAAPLSDVLSTQAELEGARATLIMRENNVEIGRSDLGFTLGLEADARILPTDDVFEVRPLSFSYEEAVARTMEAHPDLLARKYSLLESRDNLKAARYGVRYPTVSMSARYGWNLGTDEKFGGVEDLFLKNYSYSFGLSVSLPIFNRLSTENAVRTQKLRYLQNEELYDQAKRQAVRQIKLAFLNLERLSRSVKAHEASVRAAEENFELHQQRYNLGAGTFLERQTAQKSLFDARNQLVQGIYDYQIELARLEQAMGGPESGGDGE